MKSTRFLTIACAVWLTAIGASGWVLMNYESKPGRIGETPLHWPAQTKISFQKSRPILLMFAHPHCPCTRSSVGELNRLLTRCEGKVSVHVMFMSPREMPEDWAQGALWKSVAAIPDVSVQADFDGEEALRFGSESSGHVVLYSADGQLLFSGGITAARGQAGDSAGENVILSLLAGNKPDLKSTPVFGCELMGKSSPK